ncbi:MAG: PIN domain-containing protein [Planctomycetia bacterium]|nr:PIN domain-containing protein [Planctomycetia bacterium]
MPLLLLRCVFLLVSSGIGVAIVRSGGLYGGNTGTSLTSFFGLMIFTLFLIGIDMAFPKKKIQWISSVYFGLLIGLVMTYFMGMAIEPFIADEMNVDGTVIHSDVRRNMVAIMLISFSYIGISFLWQTRNDFRFIIPYVEFQKNVKGVRPLILDTSVVIDGRIADIMETKIIDSPLMMPRFAIAELQHIADSADRSRRTRGRRGLDVLNRLQNMASVELQIDDSDLPEYQNQPVDLKLVALAKHLGGKLVTNDYNLNKVAKLQGVDVINLNDLANSLKPVFLPNERIEIDIVKVGEEPGQGIAYLDDGTMVVVDQGRNHLAERVVVTVTSVLQTSAGRMIFARFEYTVKKLAGTTIVLDNSGSSPSAPGNFSGGTGRNPRYPKI